MAKTVTVVSGLGSSGEASPRSAAIGWALILGTATLVFVGTLLLKPGKER